MIMRLRPGTTVSALDFAAFQNMVQKNNDSLAKHVSNIEKMASVLTGKEVPGTHHHTPDPFLQSNAGTFPRIEKAPDQEILAELQRRLGSFSAEAWPEVTKR